VSVPFGPMTWRDQLVAVGIAIVWGLSFIAIRWGVDDTPPLLLAGLRFVAVAFPAILFFRPPRVPAWIVIGYGLAIGVFQFGLLFWAIQLGMPPGLSSLIAQAQVFFTILFAWAGMSERPTAHQAAGIALGFLGMGLIASQRTEGAALVPFLMVLGCAASWGVGNILGKMAGRVDMTGFTVWSSLAAPLPLFALSWLIEGRAGFASLLSPTWSLVGVIAYLAYLATLFGYATWAKLLSRHPAAEVTPFALLVPVFGMASSAIVFGERSSAVEWMGAGLVLAGLSWNVFGPRLMRPA
jgi:O-acetylserine/cysteine efflux transporter